jgi:ATP-dependent DNA helicase RecG
MAMADRKEEQRVSSITCQALLEQLRQLDESERMEAKRGSKVGESLLETVCAFSNKPLPRSAWRRSPNGDYRCNHNDLAELYQQRTGQSFDGSIVQGASIEDIDSDALDYYRQVRESISPSAEELNFNDKELLESLGGAVRQSDQLVPTVAGILLFGRRPAIRRLFPSNRVDYIRVPGKEWIEDPEERFTTLDMRDTLPRLIQRASAAVLDDLPKAFRLPEGSIQRDEHPILPAKVVREAIVNAVMHRNYQRHQPIQLVRYSNRLEVSNPGYSLKAIEQLGEPGSEWRNPVIASVLHEMGLAETKGSGIRVMRRLMEQADLSPPSFDSDRHRDQFAAIYLFHHFLSEDDIRWLGQFQKFGLTMDEQRALIFLRETGRISNADYRDLNRVDTLVASQHLAHLRDLQLVNQVPKGPATYYLPGVALDFSGPSEAPDRSEEDLFTHIDDKDDSATELSSSRERNELLSRESEFLSRESTSLSRESTSLSRESLRQELPASLRVELDQLGQRSRKPDRFRSVLRQLCKLRPYSVRELSIITVRNSSYLQHQYLTPMVRAGLLKLKFPEEPNRPDQAYLSNETTE